MAKFEDFIKSQWTWPHMWNIRILKICFKFNSNYLNPQGLHINQHALVWHNKSGQNNELNRQIVKSSHSTKMSYGPIDLWCS
jgi:hypothetical protein